LCKVFVGRGRPVSKEKKIEPKLFVDFFSDFAGNIDSHRKYKMQSGRKELPNPPCFLVQRRRRVEPHVVSDGGVWYTRRHCSGGILVDSGRFICSWRWILELGLILLVFMCWCVHCVFDCDVTCKCDWRMCE